MVPPAVCRCDYARSMDEGEKWAGPLTKAERRAMRIDAELNPQELVVPEAGRAVDGVEPSPT